MPNVSVIIPAYNCERFIGQTLESIRAQDLTDWECLVVDDGSTDRTQQVVEALAARDARIQYIQQANAGAAAARNHGIRRAHPDAQFIAFMDNDDLWTPDALSVLRQATIDLPGSVGAHALADMIDADGKPLGDGGFARHIGQRVGVENARVVPWEATRPTDFSVMLVKVFWPPGTFLVRRSTVMKVGPWDTGFRYATDWDLWIRVGRQGPLAFVPRVLVLYRRHDGNSSGNSKVIYREARAVRKKAFYSPENSPDQKRIVRQAYRAWQIHKIGENIAACRAHIARGRLAGAIGCAARVLGHSAYYARGFPTDFG